MVVLTVLISTILLGTFIIHSLRPKAKLKPIKVRVRK
jgi:hypothetical protein